MLLVSTISTGSGSSMTSSVDSSVDDLSVGRYSDPLEAEIVTIVATNERYHRQHSGIFLFSSWEDSCKT